MTFEQWQQENASHLSTYRNPDALCRSAFNAGRATRDGQFERIQKLNEDVQNYEAMKEGVQIRLANLQKFIDSQGKLIKLIYDALSIKEASDFGKLDFIKVSIEKFNV